MYPATEMALHLAHVCAAQRRAPATLRAVIRASPPIGTNLLPHHAAQAKTLVAVQIAGTAGAVGNAREASRLNLRPPSSRTTAAGPRPTRT
jgi:hypothetical protein